MVTANLRPERVFYYFEQISNIPRGSGNEKAVSDYCLSVAKSLSLETYTDESHNVVIRKPATKGYENAPGVIIQGHLDMVCEKDAGVEHDFLKDPIKLMVDGDWLTADGTTLGGDDGIAVAMALAILEDNTLEHPQIEVLLTTDEEVGMGGAENFDASVLQGKRLINLDSEEEGVFVVSCCGGAKAIVRIPAVWEKTPDGLVPYEIKVGGLLGGHSGSDIHLQRANASKLMGRVLRQVGKTFFYRLACINGGLMDNAITRENIATVYVDPEDAEELTDLCAQFERIFANEYSVSENGIFVECKPSEKKFDRVLDFKCSNNVIYAINLIPYGVNTVSLEMNGLVESSNNLGIVKTTEEYIDLESAVRSSVATIKYDIMEKLGIIAEMTGGQVIVKSAYPGWEYIKESPLRDIAISAYNEMFGKEPEILSIHAGLECGLFYSKRPDLDIISLGPEMHDVHTPMERFSISSVERTWKYVRFLLSKLK